MSKPRLEQESGVQTGIKYIIQQLSNSKADQEAQERRIIQIDINNH